MRRTGYTLNELIDLVPSASDKEMIVVRDGFEIIEEQGEFFIRKQKPKYPATYEECWKVRFEVDGETTLGEFHNVSGYYSEPLGALQKLLCCRDAYWKIAGEEMGLGKPWEPTTETVYGISRTANLICQTHRYGNSKILEFPTKEMRDAFYNNFKNRIESCKTLL
jgi:hypothetical protein